MSVISELISARGIQLGTLTMESAFKEHLDEGDNLTLDVTARIGTFSQHCAVMLILSDVSGALLFPNDSSLHSEEAMSTWLSLGEVPPERPLQKALSDFTIAVNAGQAELENVWGILVKLSEDYVLASTSTIEEVTFSRASSPNEVKKPTVLMSGGTFEIATREGYAESAVDVSTVANKLALNSTEVVSATLFNVVKSYISSVKSALSSGMSDDETNAVLVDAAHTARGALIGGLFKYRSDDQYNYMLLPNGVAILLNKDSVDFPAIGLTEAKNFIGDIPVAAWKLSEVVAACGALASSCKTVTNCPKHVSQEYPLAQTVDSIFAPLASAELVDVNPEIVSRVAMAVIDAISAYYTITNSLISAHVGLLSSARKLISAQASNLGTASQG